MAKIIYDIVYERRFIFYVITSTCKKSCDHVSKMKIETMAEDVSEQTTEKLKVIMSSPLIVTWPITPKNRNQRSSGSRSQLTKPSNLQIDVKCVRYSEHS